MKKVKDFVKKNWKSLSFVAAIAILILLNVKQYRESASIYRERDSINIQYAVLKEKLQASEEKVVKYQSEVAKQNAKIAEVKQEIKETEKDLAVSQDKVKSLSNKIKNAPNPIAPEDFKDYVANCDSLATVAPVLSDQVDTLKAQNHALVQSFEEKDKVKDSIIAEKNVQLANQTRFTEKAVVQVNTVTDKLQVVEKKLIKEEKNKKFWRNFGIGAAAVVTGILILK
jgi:uncharacterized coiled-coil protein SlyX